MNSNPALLNSVKWFAIAVFLYFAGTTAYGIYYQYTAVPVWDLWDGYLEFYYRSREEGWLPWWEQYNEHRLVLARFFFWIDVHFFQGNLIFLFALNFIFAVLSFITLTATLKKLIGYGNPLVLNFGIAVFAAFCFTWMQSRNFTWAFQSQFHMAYLIPLWSFLALAHARQAHSDLWFFGSMVLGFASIMTMANGVLVLPLMVVMSVLIRMKKAQSILLLVLAIVALYLYFNDYEKVPWHPSMLDSLKYHLLNSIIYFLKYLNGPLYFYTYKNIVIALLVGSVFICVCLYVGLAVLKEGRKDNPLFATLAGLVFFILFIGGTAALTALGRVQIDMNLPNRYMTPALLGWGCLLILLFYMSRNCCRFRGFLWLSTFSILVLLMHFQIKALHYNGIQNKNRLSIVALALAMQVKDLELLKGVYWDYDRLAHITRLAASDQKSIFNQNYIKLMPQLHHSVQYDSSNKCYLYLDKEVVVSDDPAYTRVRGWVYDPASQQVPLSLVFSSNSKVSGYAVTGEQRLDVIEALQAQQARYSGFSGYILSDSLQNKPIQMHAIDADNQVLCSAVIQ